MSFKIKDSCHTDLGTVFRKHYMYVFICIYIYLGAHTYRHTGKVFAAVHGQLKIQFWLVTSLFDFFFCFCGELAVCSMLAVVFLLSSLSLSLSLLLLLFFVVVVVVVVVAVVVLAGGGRG